MLNPNGDRLDYGKILAPPAEYYLDFAVGTTYSLDLDALVGTSLALGLSEETDSELLNNPICLLEALRSTGDKVALFCEGGQIHTPDKDKVSPLYILLEKMVFSIKTAKKPGHAAFPSFHPKFWLIRYKNNAGNLKYRIIVLSRNLTFDHSWDITYYMDGNAGENSSAKNEPVCDFLHYLLNRLPSDEIGRNKANEIRKLIRELPYIVFEPPEKEFYDFDFIPNGVRKADGNFYSFDETNLFQDTFHEILVISPFLSGSIIRNFNDRNKWTLIKDARYLLITREISLGRLKPEDVSNFKIYTMRDNVIDGEAAISDETQEVRKQDIHAKLYMVRKYSDSDLYIGSMNASYKAVHENIEFMIRLRAKNRYLNLDKMIDALFGREKDGSDNPFQEVTLQNAIIDEEDEKENMMEEVVKRINRSNPSAVIRAEDEEYYSVNVYFDFCETKGFDVEISPLLSTRSEDFCEHIIIEKPTITQLSEFYVISISDDSRTIERVLMIPTLGMPDDREEKVVSSVVINRDCFYRYIAFLLGDDSILSMLEASTIGGNSSGNMNKPLDHVPALYEKMLQTAAENPEKFKGIEYLMKTISNDGIIPEEFVNLFETFKKAVRLNG